MVKALKNFSVKLECFSLVQPVLSNKDEVAIKMKCLDHGHNTAPLVRFKHATLQSRVQHLTKLTAIIVATDMRIRILMVTPQALDTLGVFKE